MQPANHKHRRTAELTDMSSKTTIRDDVDGKDRNEPEREKTERTDEREKGKKGGKGGMEERASEGHTLP